MAGTTTTERPRGTDLESVQRERLQYTVEHAYDHSPFYRELMDEAGVDPADIRTPTDLDALPVVTGDDITANQPPETGSFRFRNPEAAVRRPYHTSGTTGAPKTFFYSYDEQQRLCDDAAIGFRQLGVTGDSTVANYFPYVGLNISCVGTEGAIAEIGAESIPISNTPYPPEEEYVLLERHDPDTVVGLPSHVDARSRQFEMVGCDPATLGMERILVAGEPVADSRKRWLEEIFEADVYEFLGTTEAGGFAWECPKTGRLHVNDTSVLVEAVDDEGRAVPPGEEGRLAITKLLAPGEEAAMPLVRYAVGDLVTTHRDADPACGCELRGGTRIDSPRRQSWAFSLGAVTLSPTLFEECLYADEELRDVVRDYQIEVEYDEATGQDVATLRVAVADDALVGQAARDAGVSEQPATAAENLADAVLDAHQHLRDTVDTVGAARLNIEFVADIDSPQGKPRRVVDRR